MNYRYRGPYRRTKTAGPLEIIFTIGFLLIFLSSFQDFSHGDMGVIFGRIIAWTVIFASSVLLYRGRQEGDVGKYTTDWRLSFLKWFAIIYLVFSGISALSSQEAGRVIWWTFLAVVFWFIFKKRTVNVSTQLAIEKNEPKIEDEQKYDLQSSLLTPTEEAFYSALKQVVGNQYQIIPQVQLSKIMKVRDSNKNFTNYHDFNKINKKSIDFVLYDQDLRARLAIELDDYTHSRPDRVERDNFVNKIMNEAGLRLLRIPVSDNYDLDKLRHDVLESS